MLEMSVSGVTNVHIYNS